MDTPITINKNPSIILAEGKRQGPSLGLLIVLAIASGMAILAFGLWFALSRPLPVAHASGLTITLTPSVLSNLPEDARNHLPEPLSGLSRRHSQWPVLIHVYQDEGVWHWYVILPRWLVPAGYAGSRVDRGLATALFPEKTPRLTEERSYTEALANRLAQGQASFNADARLLYPASGFASPSSTAPITGKLVGRRIVTDLPFLADQEPLGSLKEADIALNIPEDGVEGDLLKELIRRLDGGRQAQTQAPEIGQFHVWLARDGQPTATEYGYRSGLNLAQAGSILGAYGFSSRRTFVLPDGTLSVERIAPIFTGTSTPFGERENAEGERIQLEPNGLRVLAPSTTAPGALPAKLACGGHIPWLRLSGRTLAQAATAVGWENLPETVPAVQFAQESGKLVICFE